MTVVRTIIAIQAPRNTDCNPALPFLTKIGVVELKPPSLIFIDAGPFIGARRLRSKLIMLRSALRTMLGTPVRIGAGSNKTVSMIAARRVLPDGILIVAKGREDSFLSRTAIDLLPGIGRRTATYLKNRGIRTIGKFNQLPQHAAVRLFGISGVVLHEYSRGSDPREVIPTTLARPKIRGRQSLLSLFKVARQQTFGLNQNSIYG